MKVETTDQAITKLQASAIVVGTFEGSTLTGPAGDLDQATGGALGKLIETGDIQGKRNKTTTILAPAGIEAERIVVVGLGPQNEFDCGAAFQSAAAAAKSLASKSRQRVVFAPRESISTEHLEAGVCGSIVGCHGQDLYRNEKSTHPFAELLWRSPDAKTVESGTMLGDSVNLTRKLVNEPPNSMFPAAFAEEAERVAAETGMECEIWDRDRLEREKCGSLLAVARGSAKPPRLVILRYQGTDASQAPLGIVGKGVTFDSGGLSLKPSDGMKAMKCDMAGAATTLGAIRAIAGMKLPVNVVAVMGLVENMVSGDAYKLGDVLTSRSGKTIEVLNTDAEGRLVLADALNVAIDQGVSHLIDLATLTGACVVALGMDVAGVMTNDQSWCDQITSASSHAGEPTWQLPMFADYGEQIQSKVADIKNVGAGRWGGAITAAKFLEEFVQAKPWVHIDIAGPAFLESEKAWVDAGGSGAMVRTLVEVARHWK